MNVVNAVGSDPRRFMEVDHVQRQWTLPLIRFPIAAALPPSTFDQSPPPRHSASARPITCPEAHRRFRNDLRTRKERNVTLRAEQLALHEEKKRAITEWVATRATDEQRSRHAADVLPNHASGKAVPASEPAMAFATLWQ